MMVLKSTPRMHKGSVMRRIKLKVLNTEFYGDWELPKYATSESAGLDLRACLLNDVVLDPRDTFLCPTGLAVDLDDENLAMFLIPKSGLGHKKGLVLGNCIGLVDSDYSKEIFVSVWNRGTETQVIKSGDFIAQAYFAPIVRVCFDIVESFDRNVERVGGFGSTGDR